MTALFRNRRDWIALSVITAGIFVLGLTAPHGGEFWWSDSPRHALNGVFLSDLLKDMPVADLQGWAVNYYLRYPALTILFYPPLLAGVESLFFLLFGVSHFSALLAVGAFYWALGIGAYALSRRWLSPLEAGACALFLCGFTEVALWGRQIMTEIPAFALLMWAAYFFDRALDEESPGSLYAAAALLLLAAYAKLTVAFLLPVFGLVLLLEVGWPVLRNRHLWVALLLFIAGSVPLVVLTMKFGQANVQSVTGIADATVSRSSLNGWLFYGRLLPRQVGWPALALVASYLILAVYRRSSGLPRRALILLAAWFGIGYVFFSAIDLKEERHTIFLLYPLAVAAVLGVTRWSLTRSLAPVAILLAGGNLLLTAAESPVPQVSGYREAAEWIMQNAPPGRVLFSGQRDGSFIFNIRALDGGRRYAIVRADKLLLQIAVRRELGVVEKDIGAEQIDAMIRDYGVRYVVAERDFWTDLRPMQELQTLLSSNRYEEVARLPVVANVNHTDRELRIYRTRGDVAAQPRPLSVDLPIIKRSFSETPAK